MPDVSFGETEAALEVSSYLIDDLVDSADDCLGDVNAGVLHANKEWVVSSMASEKFALETSVCIVEDAAMGLEEWVDVLA